MFTQEQLQIILNLLSNTHFKTPEAEMAMKVLDICKICQKEIQPVKDGGK
jgi:hypothetical protein